MTNETALVTAEQLAAVHTSGLPIALDAAIAAPLVIAVIAAIGFVRMAWPSIPTRFIPLGTWLLTSAAYIFITKDTTSAGITAGILNGILATGTHSGIRSIMPPAVKEASKKVGEQARTLRDRFGKTSQTNKKR